MINMQKIVSKELIEKVSGYEIIEYLYKNTSLNPQGTNVVFKTKRKIVVLSVYELAYMCKKWALKQGYEIFSSANGSVAIVYGDNSDVWNWNTDKDFKEIYVKNNEIKSIFEACEWILRQS